MTVDAIDAEIDVMSGSVVECFAFEALALLLETTVTLSAVGIPERPVHPVGLLELSGHVEHGVFDCKQVDSRPTDEADAAVTVDAAEGRRVRSFAHERAGMAGGEVRGRAGVEVVANRTVQAFAAR